MAATGQRRNSLVKRRKIKQGRQNGNLRNEKRNRSWSLSMGSTASSVNEDEPVEARNKDSSSFRKQNGGCERYFSREKSKGKHFFVFIEDKASYRDFGVEGVHSLSLKVFAVRCEALVLSFVVSPLPTDVSNISNSVTLATTSPAHRADLGDLKDYQSNQTVKTSSRFDNHVSQKASNKLNSHDNQKRVSVKPIPIHGTQKDAVVKTDKSLELLGIENQTLELTTPLFEDTDTKDEPQVLSKLSSQSNTSIDYEKEPRHATPFEFISRSFPD
ncbi:hypothetical protein PoB_006370700 [Plakobranchus ocellatus]|uniref:Uncharacterized protein n=1 Tax=Plakobranchus ocellatus TaxID=259542 RepID=A0AAV4CZ55_9GAST|nr:hypothetical protein PoB_006370700 [Plakobranchus ocellatus]